MNLNMAVREVPLAHSRSHAVTLNVLSGDAVFIKALRDGCFSACVHSVFDRVVNIESDGGELWTLAGCDCDNAPNTLVIDVPGFAAFGIVRGDSCSVSNRHELRFGSGMRVRFNTASGWSEHLPVYPQEDSALRANLQWIESFLAQTGTPGGFLTVGESESAYLRAANAVLKQQTTQLVDALSQGDLDAASEFAVSVVGLGPTPSGDDYLTGLFSVLNIENSPCYRFRGLCDAVASKADRLTNVISFSALKMAAVGRVRESIIALLRDAMYGNPESLSGLLSRVLAIGSTSGTDIVSGIVSGFRLNLLVGRMDPSS
jgi:hypothetical protein